MLLQLADSGQSRPPAPARRRPLSALHPEPATGFRPQDDLSCFFQPTIQTRPAKKRLVHAEHEILIFLYIKCLSPTPEAPTAAAMLPFFLPYGFWTRQGFAHDYMAAYHHAYTVGFVSMMIVGVASRVVPILAGLDASRLSRLWGPFLLLNIGCIGRVSLQITADWFPQVAFPLVGLTGFLEVAALSWWGIELWRVMNIAANRPKLLVTSVQPARPQLISIAN
jgi:hypothetical protein